MTMPGPGTPSSCPALAQKILLVDDTPINIQMLHQVLKGEGYQLLMARSAEDALRIAREEHPDLILLDIVMPEVDGFEACRRLKGDPKTCDAVIIFMSSLSETDSKVKGLEVGAVDYITKPFEPAEVIARVNTHLTVQRLQRDLTRKNEFIRSVFGRFVSEQVAQRVLDSPEGLDLGGEEREVTILMSDLRGFTSIVNRRTPKEVLGLLNFYLESMVEVIERYDGTLIEILGDSCLVMFGAPLVQADHADRAVASALAMQLAMRDVNRVALEQGWPLLEMGIGIHTGPCVVGNIGSQRRSKYTAVGTTVNLAGRIESATMGGQVLISETTRSRVMAPLQIEGEFCIVPKGVARSLTLSTVRGIGGVFDLALPPEHHPLLPLFPPLQLSFTVLQDKSVTQTVHQGMLLEMSEREARFVSSYVPLPLDNLKVTLFDEDGQKACETYAKVHPASTGAGNLTLIRFTSLSSDVRDWVSRQLPKVH